MKKDFHYYVILLLAKKAGFNDDDAKIIAYVSQYVDDNVDVLDDITNRLGLYQLPDKIKFSDDKVYYRFPTQVSNSGNWRKLNVQRDLLMCFHFLPGDKDKVYNAAVHRRHLYRHKDKEITRFNTIRDSKNAKRLIQWVSKYFVQEKNNDKKLIQLGIALHTYADTWAHENFTGFRQGWNSIYPALSPLSLIPNVGHAEAMHSPDNPNEIWKDKRFGFRVDNPEKFIDASRKVYQILCTLTGTGDPWSSFEAQLKQIFQIKLGIFENEYDERKKKLLSMISSDTKRQKLLKYGSEDWFVEAVDAEDYFIRDILDDFNKLTELKKPEAHAKPGFFESKWYYFQESAKKQRNLILHFMGMQ